MQEVMFQGVAYVVEGVPSDEIATSDYSGKTDPVLTVSGFGYRADDPDKNPVELVWNVTNPAAEDSADLVADWDKLAAVNEL